MKNVKIPLLKILEFLHSVIWQKKLSSFVEVYFHFLSLLVPITHYMHVAIIWERVRSPTICKQVQTRFFFSLQNLRTSKVQLHCYTGEKLSCLVLSESMLHHSLNASWPRQMSQLPLAPMAKNMTLLGNSEVISKQEKRGNDYFYTYSTYFNCLDNCCW